jgi:hypothetical protein
MGKIFPINIYKANEIVGKKKIGKNVLLLNKSEQTNAHIFFGPSLSIFLISQCSVLLLM